MAKWTKKNIGEFVRLTLPPHSKLGVGKLISIEDGSASVQFFDSPGLKLSELVVVNEKYLEHARLPAQTRVYMQGSGGRWQVGRVLQDERSSIFVQFPNNETANIVVDQLQVRWSHPLVDPMPLLACETTETPFLADARSSFVNAVARQYQAANGSSAVLCSSIDLVDYQFEVVRRVLLDPVQRYLLADEVGLGKTIEASLILRQYFIDDPKATAVVVVPEALVNQWRQELIARFGMAIYLDETLHIVSHSDLETLISVIHDANMIVIDEAHHLSRQSTNEEQRLYDLVNIHSKRVERLLLLSATPVLGNAEEFLRVLHLLDPVVFPLEDLEGFKRKISSRQVVAEVVSTLVPENVWGMGPDLDRLLENYSDDALLVRKVDALKVILDTLPDEENEDFLKLLNDLKLHLVESYRLHRRILRNRRTSVSWATPRRSQMREVRFTGPMTRSWFERLDELRLSISAVENVPQTVYKILFQVAVHPNSFPSLAIALQNAGLTHDGSLQIAHSVDHAADKLIGDRTKLSALSKSILNSLEGKGVQVVVFCDQKIDADNVYEELKVSVGEHHVARHTPKVHSDDDSDPDPWEKFLSDPDQIRVLVCDSKSEEGVNLHGGRKVAYHYDLPAFPNRIEQRLGRLDRYGTGDPIVSYVLLDEGNPDEIAWANILDHGWGVFKQSVASLQYAIESVSSKLALDWVEQGTEALRIHATELGGEQGLVAREIIQLNHQDSLDALANQEIEGMEQLEDSDGEWEDWKDSFKGLAVEVLGFNWKGDSDRRSQQNSDESFRLGYSYRDSGSRQTLLPLSGFLSHFLSAVDQTAIGGNSRYPLSHRYIFKRQAATSRRGIAMGMHLLRIGDPLVTALEEFCAYDDRGRSFALWRVDRQYEVSDPSGADLYFRFDFLIEPSSIDFDQAIENTASETVDVRKSAAKRKASTFFAPLAIRIWVHGSGQVVVEPSELLTSSYSDNWKGSRRDFNLNINRWRALPSEIKSSWLKDWPELCNKIQLIAIETVRGSTDFKLHVQSALTACQSEWNLRRSQGEVRSSRLIGQAQKQELEELNESKLFYASVSNAISNPRLSLDVVGAVFLASDTPFE
jgi:ATP-dependent helicase HepA